MTFIIGVIVFEIAIVRLAIWLAGEEMTKRCTS